jgi:hypothetical protein
MAKAKTKAAAKAPAKPKTNLPAVQTAAPAAPVIGNFAIPAGLEVEARVTFQLRKWQADDPPITCQFVSAFKKKLPLRNEKPAIDPVTGEPVPRKQPPTVAEIIEYTTDGKGNWYSTGEVVELIVPTVLRGILEETYPPIAEGHAPAFVGKCFYITTKPKAANKNYRTFGLTLIAEPKVVGSAPPPAKAAE